MRALAATFVVAAVTAAAALAAGGEKEQIKLNPADQAAARRAVAHRADLGQRGWAGGAIKPDLSAAPTCANFHPKQADLVLTGAAASEWDDNGLRIETDAQVLRTEAMVAADWRRTVLAAAAIPCLRAHLLKELGRGVTLVRFRRILFPPVATQSRAYLMIVDVKTTTGKVPVALELVLIGHGRTELTIVSTAPNAAQRFVGQADVQLARALVVRAA
jgi:hypothetical protein